MIVVCCGHYVHIDVLALDLIIGWTVERLLIFITRNSNLQIDNVSSHQLQRRVTGRVKDFLILIIFIDVLNILHATRVKHI